MEIRQERQARKGREVENYKQTEIILKIPSDYQNHCIKRKNFITIKHPKKSHKTNTGIQGPKF